MACHGNESMLSECKHSGIGIHDCAEGIEEAGVICTGEFHDCCYLCILYKAHTNPSADVTCEDGTVHLVGGDVISRGRVEYCYDGSWYSICADDWNEEEARVVCNMLGYAQGKVEIYTCLCYRY